MFSSRVSGVSLEIESDREEGLLNDVVRVDIIGDLRDLFCIYLLLFICQEWIAEYSKNLSLSLSVS
jgi:hypothetical protein